jgi:hypothetical protein
LNAGEVAEAICDRYPDQQWAKRTISAELIGLSVNPSSSHHWITRLTLNEAAVVTNGALAEMLLTGRAQAGAVGRPGSALRGTRGAGETDLTGLRRRPRHRDPTPARWSPGQALPSGGNPLAAGVQLVQAGARTNSLASADPGILVGDLDEAEDSFYVNPLSLTELEERLEVESIRRLLASRQAK